MSDWQTVKREDLDISDDGTELEVYIGSDDFGSKYIEVNIGDIFDVVRSKLLNRK